MKLNHKILVAFLFCLSVGLGGSTYLILPMFSNKVAKSDFLHTSEQLEIVSKQLEKFFSLRIKEASLLSNFSEVQSLNYKVMKPKLIDFLEDNNENIVSIIIANRKGNYHVVADKVDNDKWRSSLSKSQYWKTIVGNNVFNQKRTYISDPIISNSNDLRQVVVATSIIRDHRVKGLLGLNIGWLRIKELIEKFKSDHIDLEQSKLFLISATGAYWYHWKESMNVAKLIDKNGQEVEDEAGKVISLVKNIIDEPNDELVFIGNRMILEKKGHGSYTSEGDRHIVFFHKIEGTGYTLGLDVRKKYILGPLENFKNKIISYLVGLGLLIFIFSIYFSKLIARPLQSISKRALNALSGKQLELISIDGVKDDLILKMFNSINRIIKDLMNKEEQHNLNKERLGAAYEASSDGIWDWNIKTGKVSFSPSWFTMLGYEYNELPQSFETFAKLIDEDDLERVTSALQDYLSGKNNVYRIRIPFKCKDGKIKWVLARGKIVEETPLGEPVRIVGTSVDIDKQVNFEKEMREFTHGTKQMADEEAIKLQVALEEANVAKDLAEDANEEKSQFLASVTDEFKVPLNTIIELSKSLMNSDLTTIDHSNVLSLYRSGNLLLNMTNDILVLSKIESGDLYLCDDKFKLNKLIDEVVNIVKLIAMAKGIELIYRPCSKTHFLVHGDGELLKQALINLVTTAIGLCSKGKVEFIVDLSERFIDRGLFKFSIKVIGKEENKPKKHHRLDYADLSSAKVFGHAGVKYIITKKIVGMMNGKVEHFNNEEIGTACRLSIPLKISTEVQFLDDQIAFPSYRGMTSVFIGDDVSNQNDFKSSFNLLKIKITVVDDFDLALKTLLKSTVDLVVIDEKIIGELGHVIEDIKSKVIILSDETQSNLTDISNVIATMTLPFNLPQLISILDLVKTNGAQGNYFEGQKIGRVLIADTRPSQLVIKSYLKKFSILPDLMSCNSDCLMALRNDRHDLVFIDHELSHIDGVRTISEIKKNPTLYGRPYIIALSDEAREDVQGVCLAANSDDILIKPFKEKDLREALLRFKKN